MRLIRHSTSTGAKTSSGISQSRSLPARGSGRRKFLTSDLVETGGGLRIRVQAGKDDKYRETLISADVFATATTYADTLELGSDEPPVARSTRTLGRWVDDVGDRLQEATGEAGWSEIGMHGLRRSWAGHLVDDDVSPFLIMEWGGWDDWRTYPRPLPSGTDGEEAARGSRKSGVVVMDAFPLVVGLAL